MWRSLFLALCVGQVLCLPRSDGRGRVQNSYVHAYVCSNNTRLLDFILKAGKDVLESMKPKQYSQDQCREFVQLIKMVREKINQQDENCTESDFYRALTSAEAETKLMAYPNILVDVCNHPWTGIHGIQHRLNAMDIIAEANKDVSDSLDLMETDIRLHRRKRNAVNVKEWLWKNDTIPYLIDQSSFSIKAATLIIEAINQFNKDISCVKFVPRTDQFDYVVFKSGTGCQSSIGRDGGEQFIVLGESCYYKGVVMHEMTHAVGFFHEQNRFDRDDYITMHWNNMEPGKEHDFQIQQKDVLTTLGAPYDFGSIMHYSPYTFAKDPKQEVMTPKYDPHVQMGQRDGFSELDIWKINTLYGCETGPPPSPAWMQYLSSTIKVTTPNQTPSSTTKSTKSTQKTTPIPGIPGKPNVLVTVFPNALRINWEKPDSDEQITGYIITYKLEPDGQPVKISVSPNKLAYYLNTYTTHPGRRYTISVAAVTNTTVGPESDPVTVRSACSHDIYLYGDTYNQIHSPFFKNGYYEQDVVCQWKLTAPEGQRVNLTFRDLNIDGSSQGCNNDVVRIGESDDFCNVPPPSGYYLSKGNTATVTFMSRPGPSEVKAGGFNMSASAEGFAPTRVRIERLPTAFNISWQPPEEVLEHPTGYLLEYGLAGNRNPKVVTMPANANHMILSTGYQFGREFEIRVFTKFSNRTSASSGPYFERSLCERNITVSTSNQHLGSPHFPARYEPDTLCLWNVDALPGHRFAMTFKSFDLDLDGSDFVRIDGDSPIRFDGRSPPDLSSQIVATKVSIKFYSNERNEGSGFQLNLQPI